MPEKLKEVPGTDALLRPSKQKEQFLSPSDLVCYVGQPNVRMQPGDVGRVSKMKPANPERDIDVTFDGKTMTFHRENIIAIRMRCRFA